MIPTVRHHKNKRIEIGSHSMGVFFCTAIPNVRPVSLPPSTLESYASSPVSVGKSHHHHQPLSGKNSVSSTMSFGESASSIHQMSSTSTLVPNQSPTRDELISTLEVKHETILENAFHLILPHTNVLFIRICKAKYLN